jgi:hypothetical protein
MIIAMVTMGMMQPPVHEVINVITVRHAFMSATRPMCVRASRVRRAAQGVGGADLNNVLLDMIFMHVVQMTIVQVVDMVLMRHGGVSTARTMLMSVIWMMLLVAKRHRWSSFLGYWACDLSGKIHNDAMLSIAGEGVWPMGSRPLAAACNRADATRAISS